MSQAALGTTRLRLAFLGAIFASLIATLALRLYFLQVLNTAEFAEGAQRNQIRLVPEQPARGQILDRNGEVLVSNGMSLVVSIRRQELSAKELNDVINRLAPVLGVPVEELNTRLADKSLSAFTPIPIAENVPEDVVIYLREHQDEFPKVETNTQPTRIYPQAKLASHVLGYLGEIQDDQINSDRYKALNYRPGSIIGRSGIEYAYEKELHGVEGLRKLEVDSSGEVRRILGRKEPERGLDLVTTIDARIQRVTEESLAQGIEKARTIYHEETGTNYRAPAGGAVVMDPRSGEIIAMASFPDYDPGAFVGGISVAEYEELTREDTGLPLINRAIQVSYPPGSTFKTVTAAAALETGVAQVNQRYACPASVRIADRTFRNWKTTDSGLLTFNQSMADSCDTVFYDWGLQFYRTFTRTKSEVLQDYARRFGFGEKTGIEIPSEKAGRVPDDGWLKRVNKELPDVFPYATWLPGYTINMSIGQGDVLATPLQLANSYAAIANGGTLYQPHFGLKFMDGNEEVSTVKTNKPRSVQVSPANIQAIRSSLEAVTTVGTAAGTFLNSPLSSIGVAGKTGTAEIGGKQPYAWFAAYAPARDPQYVIAVMLEEGGHGGETAAPIARRIFEGIFALPLSEIKPQAPID